jgi:hypothetical protein
MHKLSLDRTWKHCWNLFSKSTFIIVILPRRPSGDSKLYPFCDMFNFGNMGTSLARAVGVPILVIVSGHGNCCLGKCYKIH